jgi:transposase
MRFLLHNIPNTINNYMKLSLLELAQLLLDRELFQCHIPSLTLKKNYHDTQQKDYDIALNTQKILEESKYDGFYAIQTSRKDLSAKEIIHNYHMLYRIEDSFRVLKSTMKTGPIYHWTEQRIKGHFMMCFIAFLLERELENKMKDDDMSASPEAIKKALYSMQISEIELENQHYYLKGKNDTLGSKIFAKYRLKLPKNMSTKEEIHEYMKLA